MVRDASFQGFATLAPRTANFTGTGVAVVTPRRGMHCEVRCPSIFAVSGGTTVIFSLDQSNDNGSTWFNITKGVPIAMPNGAGNAVSITQYLFFDTSPTYQNSPTPLVRLVMTITGSPTSPSVTFEGVLSLGEDINP